MKNTARIRRRLRLAGIGCGVAAAVCYGTNPFGALNLYRLGMNTGSVLFYRFALAWVTIAIVMLFRNESARVSARQFGTLSALGILFVVSSVSLYASFRVMAAGIASTLLFVYPVMTTAIMALLFHEPLRKTTVAAIGFSLAGVALLYKTDEGGTLPAAGVALVLLSALSYAVYIVIMGRAKLRMSSFKINFYVLAYCALGALAYAFCNGQPLQLPPSAEAWLYVGWLAVVPAIMALVLMVYAAKLAGSTATAITGALEPLTAVIIGVTLFGEPFGTHTAIGIVLILSAVILISVKK